METDKRIMNENELINETLYNLTKLPELIHTKRVQYYATRESGQDADNVELELLFLQDKFESAKAISRLLLHNGTGRD